MMAQRGGAYAGGTPGRAVLLVVLAVLVGAPAASAWVPTRNRDMGIVPEYAIAFVYDDASLDEAVERVRSRGVLILYVYDGAGAYAFRVTEAGTELTTVHYDPATKVITYNEGGLVSWRFG